MRKPMVVGNWKMNGSKERVHELVNSINNGVSELDSAVDLMVIPPAILIPQVSDHIAKSVQIGAQNVSEYANEGAYTGEISCDMLKDFDVSAVLAGHSERRTLFKETDEIVANKVIFSLSQGLKPILCVGETLSERESGQTETVIERQVSNVFKAVLADENAAKQVGEMIIAYEPVWAIGSGKSATPELAQEVHAYIRTLLKQHVGQLAEKIRILYGGSVKSDNALAIFKQTDIDGGLVGGASLLGEEFLAIAKMAKA